MANGFIQNDQAQEAVQTALDSGAEPNKERAKSTLLEQMTAPPPGNAAGEPAAETEATGGASQPDGERDGTDGSNAESSDVRSEQAQEAVDGEGDSASSPATDDEVSKPKNLRIRLAHLNEQERRVVELTTRRGLTLTEAYRAVYGPSASAAEATGNNHEPSADNASQALVEIERQIGDQERQVDELKRKKASAKDDLAAYDQASEAYLEARERLRGLREERRAEAARREAEAADARKRATEIAQASLADEFPDALTPGTELHDACAEELDYLREANSPLIRDPQVHYKVARRLARTLGYRKAAQPRENSAPVPKNTAVAPKRTVRPLPTGGSPLEAPATALERRVADARSSDAMLTLMREFGTPFEALLQK